ncbi:outer membrane protein assembly factor BamA [Segatella baroniae B14]|jgi:outer membrane protein insertion porin family|uniref:Outer membrane protein assembly factor n=3 Tax=Prevotellaceae TaxID=171552 RepID=A0AA37HXU4_SEGBR|nr:MULTISPECIES: POTRA domain-containing protein [Segatella]OYP55762.1 outer membrane protein assembly factor BamA [Segatella bryantii]UKK76339.1 outer membrane protein assembly factor BamA [Segatella bryantii]UKK77938.1 outer membrane protein assembly factor BamA [Segatella baroniae B14]UKK80982.1 outer membrane protein assembly factor BamA [Segatella bryantii]SEP88698.1 Beta-barrel assembly machine subunit BamA [Segatella baroniae B14]
MNTLHNIVVLTAGLLASTQMQAQDKIINPDISYAGTPRTFILGGINVTGVEGYEDYVLTGISGLTVGQNITVPGTDISDAVKRYWRHGLFSKVTMAADSIVGDKLYLHISLAVRPRVSTINYEGLKKSEREDMEQKLGLLKGSQLTPNMIDRAKILAQKYFDDKGYKNAEIDIRQREDVSAKNEVILDVIVDKKEKMKVHKITIDGNEQLTDKQIKGSLFTKGAFSKTHEAGKIGNIFKSKKFTPERWKTDKQNLIDKYNEHGFRDANILKDSVSNYDVKHVDVYVQVEEGKKYYIRNITWVGNTVYTTDQLSRVLGMKKGDVYNQKLLNKRLSEDEDAVGNLYWNNGYLFYNLQPTEINIVGDSIDLEMRITEGQQAHINRVRINGNDRLYENVVRRELRTKPGDLFSKDALQRSVRELASMGHFDPEKVNPDVKPNYEDGTVDINWNLAQKSNDQIEFSLGWGQTGVIGRVGLKLNNFSMRNLFNKNKEHRGIMPVGDGEVLSIGAQTNGSYYQSYNVSYSTNWFGGKRPNQFSVSAYYSKQTDVSSNYYNNAYYNNYFNYLSGYGSSYSSSYSSYYDPDKYVQMIGFSLGWGKRLRWPDDYFTLSAQLSYQRYMLKNWSYFLMTNGTANNLNLTLSLNRTSTDNQLFPRRGSEFSASVTLTPPWSLFDNKDYASLANNPYSSTYDDEMQEKYRWVEYHKWKFKSRTFTALSGGQKCFVLMTRVEMGLLGSYNKNKKSPFETFYVGGDGMSGYSTGYAEETVGLRGYENGSLAYRGYAYDRFTLELRYPFLLGNTTIYGLTFLEGGNAWTDTKKFNPFDMKRSAGVGVRIYLPMVGLMGIDWAYGFDKDNINLTKGGSQFHFILGQEF